MHNLKFAITLLIAWVVWSADADAQTTQPAAAEPSPPPQLVIIAPSTFHDAMAEYVHFKQSRLTTRLIDLENAVEVSTGADVAERLKRFLFNQWKAHPRTYVLLVGDVDVMPARYMVLDRCTTPAFDYAFYVSDLYYADVAKPDGTFDDWNGRDDDFHARYIGEVRGEKNKTDPINFDKVSYEPEIAVGRWPLSSVEEVKNVAAKSMVYELGIEKNNKPGANTIALLACGGWVDGRGVLDNLANSLPTDWKSEKRYYADAPGTGRDDHTPPPDAAQAVALLNAGVNVMVHIGHGFDNGWAGSLTLSDLPNIHNADRLPIMISAGCGTGVCAAQAPYESYTDMDGKEHAGTNGGEVFTAPPPPPACYQRGPHNPSSMGEQMLRKNLDGAVAYIGCNTGGQPCAVTLVQGFVSAIGELKNPRLGDCWNAAVRYYIEHEHLAELKPTESWYPPSIFYQPMKYMVYGDPSLPFAR